MPRLSTLKLSARLWILGARLTPYKKNANQTVLGFIYGVYGKLAYHTNFIEEISKTSIFSIESFFFKNYLRLVPKWKPNKTNWWQFWLHESHFGFGQKSANCTFHIYMLCFFVDKLVIWGDDFIPFLIASVLKHAFYEKTCTQVLLFCVYNVVSITDSVFHPTNEKGKSKYLFLFWYAQSGFNICKRPVFSTTENVKRNFF